MVKGMFRVASRAYHAGGGGRLCAQGPIPRRAGWSTLLGNPGADAAVGP